MSHRVKLFRNDRSQALRLPAAYRFEDCEEVFIRRDPETGDVILSRRPGDWDSFFEARQAALEAGGVPGDFLGAGERGEAPEDRDPFRGWRE